jgi:hypothetical protein
MNHDLDQLKNGELTIEQAIKILLKQQVMECPSCKVAFYDAIRNIAMGTPFQLEFTGEHIDMRIKFN